MTLLPPSPSRLQQDSLPFLAEPHDALRQGLVTLKDGASASHPVEQIQRLAGPAGEQSRLEMLRNVYGTALPARMQIEKQILDRCGLRRRGWGFWRWQRGGLSSEQSALLVCGSIPAPCRPC